MRLDRFLDCCVKVEQRVLCDRTLCGLISHRISYDALRIFRKWYQPFYLGKNDYWYGEPNANNRLRRLKAFNKFKLRAIKTGIYKAF